MTRCPNKTITREVADVARMYAMSQRGLLPEAGGTNDQTAVSMAAMDIFEAAYQHTMAEKAKEKD